VLLYERSYVCATAEDGHPRDKDALFDQIIVDESADFVGEARIVSNFPQQGDAGVARAVDEGSFFGLGALLVMAFGDETDGDSFSGCCNDANHEIGEINRTREPGGSEEENYGITGDASNEICEEDSIGIVDGYIAISATIEAGEVEGETLDGDPDRNANGNVAIGGTRQGEVEAEKEGGEAGDSEGSNLRQTQEDQAQCSFTR